jgi:hypothetical protein
MDFDYYAEAWRCTECCALLPAEKALTVVLDSDVEVRVGKSVISVPLLVLFTSATSTDPP